MVQPDSEELSARVVVVVAQVRPQLVKALKTYGVAAVDSEDLLQDALVALLSKWPAVREPAGWLVGTVHHLCQAHSRRQLRRKTLGADPALLEQLAGADVSGADECEVRLDLERLLRPLPPRQRRLLRLVALGLDDHELARALGGLKPASVRQARSRAIAQLKALLARPSRPKL
jgi:RNA polymerase sigma factor (sigma-70 family)